jgi:hypothetical protein
MSAQSLALKEQWEALSTEDIEAYIQAYKLPTAPGKFSSRRRKKLKYLRGILKRRKKILHLINAL